MNLRLALLALALSFPARATELIVAEGSGVDLPTLTATDASDADVRLTPLLVEARFGVRVERTGQKFETSTPLVVRQVLVVRDAKQVEYRLRVRAGAEGQRLVEVQPLAPEQAGAAKPAGGLFRTTSVLVNGAPGNVSTQALKLLPDGRYQIGGATGTWTLEGSEGVVALDGYYARWGQGLLSLDGQSITFEFSRGPAQFVQVMTLQTEVVATANR
jgi:hypothetical protein